MIVPDSEDPVMTAKGMFKKSGLLGRLLESKKAERRQEEKKIGKAK
jgi:hypothetical protein